ncbi:UNVERIFIED_ORG: hypothetical protein ABRZ91_002852 [Heyndrickxia coagulans]
MIWMLNVFAILSAVMPNVAFRKLSRFDILRKGADTLHLDLLIRLLVYNLLEIFIGKMKSIRSFGCLLF